MTRKTCVIFFHAASILHLGSLIACWIYFHFSGDLTPTQEIVNLFFQALRDFNEASLALTAIAWVCGWMALRKSDVVRDHAES